MQLFLSSGQRGHPPPPQIPITTRKSGSGSVCRDTNPDPDPGHIRKMRRNKQWQIIKINLLRSENPGVMMFSLWWLDLD